MRELCACVLVLAACGGGPPASSSLANARAVPIDETDGDPEPKGCRPEGEVQMRVANRATTVALVACAVRETAQSELPHEQGLVTTEMVAQLVWHGRGERPKRKTIREWTNGWEWGGSVSVVGVLVGPPGKDGALVIQHSSHETGGSTHGITVYAFDSGWNDLGGDSGTSVRVELAKDGSSLSVETCSLNQDNQAPGTDCDETTGTVVASELRWTGTTLQRKALP